VRKRFVEENLSARGAYELSAASGKARVSIFASGSEISLAVAAQAELEKKGIPARVVSVPCFELFFAQPASYRHAVIGDAPRVAVEAAIRQGWDPIIGTDGAFVGMTGFGASGPYKDVYKHFGITTEAVVDAALGAIGNERGAGGVKAASHS
jgi:transketolase